MDSSHCRSTLSAMLIHELCMEALEAADHILDLVLLREDGGAQVECSFLLPESTPCKAQLLSLAVFLITADHM